MFLSLKSRHTCVSIGRGPVRRLRVYTSVQCRQRAHGTDPCRVLMRCWLGLSCKLWCNATKLTSPRDVTSSKYENVSTCCKLWVNTEDINFGHLIEDICPLFELWFLGVEQQVCMLISMAIQDVYCDDISIFTDPLGSKGQKQGQPDVNQLV